MSTPESLRSTMYLSRVLPTILVGLLSHNSRATVFDHKNQGETDITSISPIPPGATEINYIKNAIVLIPTDYFTGLPGLASINLRSNSISDIIDNAFSSVPSLQELHLGKNKLSVIRMHMFSGLFKLRELTLNDNIIRTIEHGSFQDLSMLTKLSIKENMLATLDQCVFNVTAHPSHLEMYLHFNAWDCQSDLSWLLTANGKWMTFEDNGTPAECSTPPVLAGRLLSSVTTKELMGLRLSSEMRGKSLSLSIHTFLLGRSPTLFSLELTSSKQPYGGRHLVFLYHPITVDLTD